MPPALSYANVVQAALVWQAHRILAGCLFPALATPALQILLGWHSRAERVYIYMTCTWKFAKKVHRTRAAKANVTTAADLARRFLLNPAVRGLSARCNCSGSISCLILQSLAAQTAMGSSSDKLAGALRGR